MYADRLTSEHIMALDNFDVASEGMPPYSPYRMKKSKMLEHVRYYR